MIETQEATVSITSVAHGGHGVARIDGRVCFIPYALPGDVVRIAIAKQSKGVLWGHIEEVIEPSPHRTLAPCAVFGACGGCTWLHFAYPAQAEAKQQIVRDSFERIAREEVQPRWVEDASLRLGYRTRATFHGAKGARGFYGLASHDVVPIDACPLCHPHLNAALAQLRETDFAGSVEIAVNPEGEDVLVWTKHPSETLRTAFPECGANPPNEARASFLFDGVPIVNGTFSQSSLLLNRLLRDTVRDMVGGAARVLDLYCGNGNLSLALTGAVDVFGLDESEPAVRAADRCGRGTYRRGNESAFGRALARQAWDVVLLDPPRTGAKAIMPQLAEADAPCIVYVSCDPATLARDVKTLADSGWRIDDLAVIDMFPQTAHVETLCRLTR